MIDETEYWACRKSVLSHWLDQHLSVGFAPWDAGGDNEPFLPDAVSIPIDDDDECMPLVIKHAVTRKDPATGEEWKIDAVLKLREIREDHYSYGGYGLCARYIPDEEPVTRKKGPAERSAPALPVFCGIDATDMKYGSVR
jgi:hypothetical protein